VFHLSLELRCHAVDRLVHLDDVSVFWSGEIFLGAIGAVEQAGKFLADLRINLVIALEHGKQVGPMGGSFVTYNIEAQGRHFAFRGLISALNLDTAEFFPLSPWHARYSAHQSHEPPGPCAMLSRHDLWRQ